MVDERYLEPDYYIDRPPASVYVPPDMGSDKATYMDERNDPDLFDFKQEAEPILQVLVGKALEHARIEVIEEYEQKVQSNGVLPPTTFSVNSVQHPHSTDWWSHAPTDEAHFRAQCRLAFRCAKQPRS